MSETTEREETAEELLRRLGKALGQTGVGWGGCRCLCHGAVGVMRAKACCRPSSEEIALLLSLAPKDESMLRTAVRLVCAEVDVGPLEGLPLGKWAEVIASALRR